MLTGKQFLDRLSLLTHYEAVYRFPYVHLIVVAPHYAALELEDRERELAERLSIPLAEMRTLLRNLMFHVRLLSPDERQSQYPADLNRGYSWLRALIERRGSRRTTSADSIPYPIPTIHFYGYKGGQSRSTCLAFLANCLARDGWRVLCVDADVEAPSLDTIFSRSPRSLHSTLLGFLHRNLPLEPDRAFTAASGPGSVDFIAFAPRGPEYELDASALLLDSTIDPSRHESAAVAIGELAQRAKYDVIFVDHRSGASSSSLPWMNRLPGPVVVFARLDRQWRTATGILSTILSINPSNPGVFVSFKPDDENDTEFVSRNRDQIDDLLSLLASAVNSANESTDGDSLLSAVELSDHWLMWPYDQAFREFTLPGNEVVGSRLASTILDLRRLLQLEGKRRIGEKTTLHPSGSRDEGDLIQTQALRELMAPQNSFAFILGRKGTGKTRLVRELSRRGIGEPLLVASDSRLDLGLPSGGLEMQQAIRRFGKDPQQLWWYLLAAALETGDTNTSEITQRFGALISSTANTDASQVCANLAVNSPRRTFFIDGVETAFPAERMFLFVEALFEFLQAVEVDPRLSEVITCKLFLRTDLAERGVQNVEQQIFGRHLNLFWDTQRIFNFVLSRMFRLHFFKQNFPSLIQEISAVFDEVLNGTLSIQRGEDILMLAFPERLPRNNISTKTFLRTYFTDNAPERNNYPRVYDKFLEVIADSANSLGYSGPRIEGGRISQQLIFFAHEHAAREYLNQLRSELLYLIRLDDSSEGNSDKLESLLTAFAGLQTPFVVDHRVAELSERTSLPAAVVRDAMEKMKRVGMFEDRPRFPGEWRVGRLFKSSLKMKYVR